MHEEQHALRALLGEKVGQSPLSKTPKNSKFSSILAFFGLFYAIFDDFRVIFSVFERFLDIFSTF